MNNNGGLNELKEKLERYLTKTCGDLWSVHIENIDGTDVITGEYKGHWKFSLGYENDELYFTGYNVSTNIIEAIYEIIHDMEYPDVERD